VNGHRCAARASAITSTDVSLQRTLQPIPNRVVAEIDRAVDEIVELTADLVRIRG
jgi:hypothetical protein